MALDLYLHAVWGELTYQQVDGNWTQIQGQFNSLQSAFAQSIPKTNLTATTAPTVNDDSSAGYRDLSRWYDTVTETLYICIDPSPGAAVWIEDDFDPLGFGSAALAQLGTAPDEVPQNSDLGSAAYLNFGTGADDLLKKSAGDALYPEIGLTLTAGTGLTGGGDLSANRSFGVDIAADADLYAGESEKIPDAAGLYSAAAVVASTGSGSWAPDFEAGRNFQRTLSGNSTLANPTNQTNGQSGLIYVIQNGTGTYTLAYGNQYEFLDDVPTINTAANAVNVFSYYVRDAGSRITLAYLGRAVTA